MPLSPPAVRQLRHRRAINVEAFERDDGLWDIEACLTDTKPRDMRLGSGIRPQGLPIHELHLRVTVNRALDIVDAESSSDWVPYPGHCDEINPAYRALIGLNLTDSFRRHVAQRLGARAGCTHLTELCAVLPTAAIQAVFNHDADRSREASNPSAALAFDGEPREAPFQLDRCHALRLDGEVVKLFYPRWYGHTPRAVKGVRVAPASHTGNEVMSNSQT